jgi:chromosome segregation ATPase
MLNSEAKEKALLKLEHQRETESLQTKINDLEEQHQDGQENLAALEDILRNKEDTVSDLINTYSQEKSSMQRQIDQLRDRNDEYLNKVALLNEQRRIESKERRALQADLERETNDLKDEINNLRRTNNSNEGEIAQLEQKLKQVKDEKSDLKDAAYETKKELENKLRDLRAKNDGNNAMIASLEDDLKNKEAQEQAQKDAYEDTKQEMEDQIKQLQDDYLANKDKLSDLEDERKKQLAALSSDLEDAKDNLAKATDELGRAKEDLADREKELDDALQMAQNRRDLAKRIGDNFKSHGIVADVNKKTGDVVLDFGRYYFDTDSHELKKGMEDIIRKAIPVYAQSLFGSQELGSNISSVEIIGFASPTYAGKPVDPTELSAQNRRAVNYNLDLSYRRARSIFEFIFDTDNIRFDHQDQMVHLLNVTGRSFFTEKVDPRDTGGLTIDQFCRQYDCLKSQRVIIKFGLSETET